MSEDASGLTGALSVSSNADRKVLSVFFDVTNTKYRIIVTASQILIRLLSRVLMRIFYKLEREGVENAEIHGKPVLIVSNHKSYFDPLVISESLSIDSPVFPIRFIAKDTFFQSLISRLFFLGIGAFPAYYRQGIEKSLATPLKILRNSGTVLFFPEGKCIREEALGEGKIGAAVLALKFPDALILPIAIHGSYKIMHSLFFSRPVVRTRIGKPFYLKDRIGKQLGSTPEEVTNIIMDEIKSLFSKIDV